MNASKTNINWNIPKNSFQKLVKKLGISSNAAVTDNISDNQQINTYAKNASNSDIRNISSMSENQLGYNFQLSSTTTNWAKTNKMNDKINISKSNNLSSFTVNAIEVGGILKNESNVLIKTDLPNISGFNEKSFLDKSDNSNF